MCKNRKKLIPTESIQLNHHEEGIKRHFQHHPMQTKYDNDNHHLLVTVVGTMHAVF